MLSSGKWRFIQGKECEVRINRTELSKRLRCVADCVPEGARLADIGTDHGYIPICLVAEGICPRAVACDVNRGPLERAGSHVAEAGLEGKISLRSGDGLRPLSVDEVDCIVIAGMGGSLICQILQDSPEFMEAGKTLVLQPQSEVFKVRRLLHEKGYRIEGEWNLSEDGKYYVILRALPGRETYRYAGEYEYGQVLIREKNPLLQEHLKRQLQKKTDIVRRLSEENHKDRIRKLQEEIREISRILKEMECQT